MANLTLTSNAFQHEGAIPSTYSCDGEDISPQLSWQGVPEGTKSFTLVCDDPDAPMGTFVHWVLFNIPAEARELPENFSLASSPLQNVKGGINDFKKYDYGGPCPPGGTHRYYFTLYALDTTLNLEEGVTKESVLNEMQGHVLGQAQLMGTYEKQ